MPAAPPAAVDVAAGHLMRRATEQLRRGVRPRMVRLGRVFDKAADDVMRRSKGQVEPPDEFVGL